MALMDSRKVSLLSAMLALAGTIEAFGWRGLKPASATFSLNQHPSSQFYATALSELQELESEPLCHRIAARLLVSNCQLIDGQNDATVMTDTGRAARDFVDSFAASLAICDLARANFDIPSSCDKFREPVLANLPAPAKPQLHVLTSEIDKCLEGLATSDSAWNTWVSYRHKALRFCEAARADHDKDQHIVLHKRLASILEKLTKQAESELTTQVEKIDGMLQDSSRRAQMLKQQMEQFKAQFSHFESRLADAITTKSKETEIAIAQSMKGAEAFQDLLNVAFSRIAMWENRFAQAHESALNTAATHASQGVNEIAEVVREATVLSLSLQAQLGKSEDQITAMMRKQEEVQKKLNALGELADLATDKHTANGALLQATHNKTSQILSSINEAASSINAIQTPLLRFGWTGWWPYVACPAASLLFGSYGLQPSLTRNLLLLGVGEVAGLFLSYAREYRDRSAEAGSFLSRFDLRAQKANVADELIYDANASTSTDIEM